MLAFPPQNNSRGAEVHKSPLFGIGRVDAMRANPEYVRQEELSRHLLSTPARERAAPFRTTVEVNRALHTGGLSLIAP